MRLIFVLFFIANTLVASAQKNITKDEIYKVIIHQPYHCDSLLQQFEHFMQHGEEKIGFTFLSVTNMGNNILVKGRIVDATADGLQANIYSAFVADTICRLEQKITQSDQNGKFEISITKDLFKSLYFMSIGYHDAQIKLADLLVLLE